MKSNLHGKKCFDEKVGEKTANAFDKYNESLMKCIKVNKKSVLIPIFVKVKI